MIIPVSFALFLLKSASSPSFAEINVCGAALQVRQE